jgi:lipopolysaccharide transport system ATP-binding protein
MSEPVIIFDHVSKSYPLYHHITGGIKNFLFHLPKALSSMKNVRYEVLKDISFEVYKGETLGIIGRNGVGKSTTLGLIAGVLKPSKGKVFIKGKISPFLELGGGFHQELTGKENIMLNGVLLGLTRNEVKRRLDEIIEFSGLGDFIYQPIRTYSSGMYMRLGFSVIAHLDPEILLIDEVLAVGDMEFQKKCLDKMMSFKKSGVTMIFVSHSTESVERICDRAIWIDNQLIRMAGLPKDVVLNFSKLTL